MPEVWIVVKNRDTGEALERFTKRDALLRWIQEVWVIHIPLLIEMEEDK